MLIYNIKINGSKVFKIVGSIVTIIVICLFIYTIYKIFGLSKNEGCTNNPNNISNISADNYTEILKSVHDNIDSYVGKKISFSGYVYRVYDFDENQFVLARDMVVSSDSQTVVVGFLCESKNVKTFQDGTWVNINGEITKGNYHGEIPVIKITRIEECGEPENSLVYPPDETYLQTSEI